MTASQSPRIWIPAGILAAAVVYLVSITLFYGGWPPESWYNPAGDAGDYLLYAKGISEGQYTNGGSFYSRMPLYPLLLALFTGLAGEWWGLSMLVWLQVLLSGVATYCGACLTRQVTGTGRGFVTGFVLFATFPLLKSFDYFLLTESPALSLFVIFLWLIIRPGNVMRPRLMFLAGVLLAAVIMLRPFMAVAALTAVIFVYLKPVPGAVSFTGRFRAPLLLLLPLLLFEAWWLPRNYALSGGKVIPFQENTYGGLGSAANADRREIAYGAIWGWANAVGEDIVFWTPGTFGAYIYSLGPFAADSYDFSDRVMCSAYTRDDLARGKEMYARMMRLPEAESGPAADSLIAMFTGMTEAYKQEKPFQYHVVSRFMILKHALVNTGPILPLKAWPEIKEYPFQLGIKLWSVLCYGMVLLMGMALAAYTLIRFGTQKSEVLLLSLTAFLLVAALGFGMRMTESRLYLLSFPVWTVFCASALSWRRKK